MATPADLSFQDEVQLCLPCSSSSPLTLQARHLFAARVMCDGLTPFRRKTTVTQTRTVMPMRSRSLNVFPFLFHDVSLFTRSGPSVNKVLNAHILPWSSFVTVGSIYKLSDSSHAATQSLCCIIYVVPVPLQDILPFHVESRRP